MVPTDRDGAGGADRTGMALRASDFDRGVDRVDCELSPASAFVFFPGRECRVHYRIYDDGVVFAPRREDRLASANDEGRGVAAADGDFFVVRSGIYRRKISDARPSDHR